MRKMVIPTLIALLFAALMAVYIRFVLLLQIPGIYKIVGTIVLLSLIITMGYLLARRYKEVKEEDSDDLSKY